MTEYIESVYRHCHLLRTLVGRRVFVAGGTGFFGRWIVAVLRHTGAVVEYGSRSHNGWNILNPDTYIPFQTEAEYIINCAGRADIDCDPSVIGDGPAMLYGSKGPQATFLHVSSGVVGKGAMSAYALAKQTAENSLDGACGVQIVRPYATVGPHMGLDKSFAISTFLRRRMRGQCLEVAIVKRSFCHIVDLVIQMIYVMLLGDGKPYEAGSDDGIFLEEAARMISNDVQLVDNRFPSNAQGDYVADLSRIRSQFSLTPSYSSLQAVKDTFDWYVSNPKNS